MQIDLCSKTQFNRQLRNVLHVKHKTKDFLFGRAGTGHFCLAESGTAKSVERLPGLKKDFFCPPKKLK